MVKAHGGCLVDLGHSKHREMSQFYVTPQYKGACMSWRTPWTIKPRRKKFQAPILLFSRKLASWLLWATKQSPPTVNTMFSRGLLDLVEAKNIPYGTKNKYPQHNASTHTHNSSFGLRLFGISLPTISAQSLQKWRETMMRGRQQTAFHGIKSVWSTLVSTDWPQSN